MSRTELLIRCNSMIKATVDTEHSKRGQERLMRRRLKLPLIDRSHLDRLKNEAFS